MLICTLPGWFRMSYSPGVLGEGFDPHMSECWFQNLFPFAARETLFLINSPGCFKISLRSPWPTTWLNARQTLLATRNGQSKICILQYQVSALGTPSYSTGSHHTRFPHKSLNASNSRILSLHSLPQLHLSSNLFPLLLFPLVPSLHLKSILFFPPR